MDDASGQAPACLTGRRAQVAKHIGEFDALTARDPEQLLSLPDSALVQRRLAVHNFFVIAAPASLARHGRPGRPEDLTGHAEIVASAADTVWRMAAAARIGIAVLPTSVCAVAIESGAPERVLPDWTVGKITTTILIPHRRCQLPSVRAVVDFLIERAGV